MSSPADFVLEGARRILGDWNYPPHLKELIEETEDAVRKGSDKAIDGAKCLMECVCKTILEEHGVEYKKDCDVNWLVKKTATALGISPDNGDGPLRQIASGLSTITQGLAELRNDAGPLGHGKRADHPPLSRHHRTLAVATAEAVAVVLYEAHAERPLNLKFTRKPYDPEEYLNERIDAAVTVSVDLETSELIVNDSMRFRPSQIMYELDREAYVDIVNSLPDEDDDPHAEPEGAELDDAMQDFQEALQADWEGEALEPAPERGT